MYIGAYPSPKRKRGVWRSVPGAPGLRALMGAGRFRTVIHRRLLRHGVVDASHIGKQFSQGFRVLADAAAVDWLDGFVYL